MRATSLGAVLVLGLTPVAAQEPAEQAPATVPVREEAPPPAESEAVALDSIEVTAQRRVQRLVDVPLSVTAITQDQVEVRGITRLDDLNSVAPGLQVSRSPSNTTISQLAIRGSSQINPAITWDPAVGLYLDGVFIGKSQGAIFDVVDLAGVEVLRGPQGTLYGRNTIAGTINLVTREPSGNFGGNAAVEYGTFNNRILRAAMDAPRIQLGDIGADLTFGVRSERRDPWIEATPRSPVDGLNNRHNDGLHLASYMDLTDHLQAVYRFDFSDTDQTNNFLQLYRSGDPRLAPYVSRTRRDTADINAPSAEQARVQGHALTLNWDVSEDFAVKGITAYRKVKWVDKLDLDGTPETVAQSERHTDYDQFSQDIQLSGGRDALRYTGGIYYFADDGYTVNPIYLQEGLLDFDSRYGTRTDAWAVYGQADWQVREALTLAAGARYTREKKELDRVFGERPSTALPYVYYMPPGYQAPGATFDAMTPMLSAAWRVSPKLNVYARYAEGFKSGGYNGEYSSLTATPQQNQQETNTPYNPEKQKSFELGAKSSFRDGRALVNVAAFHNLLDDLQISIFTADGAAASKIRNAGKATVQGIEVETAFVLRQGTQLRANYAWLNPEYTEFLDAEPTGVPGQVATRNAADNRAFVHAPERSWNVVLDSELLTTGSGTLRAVADYVWTDSFYTYPYQLAGPGDANYDSQKQRAPDTEVPAYGLLNARLMFTAIPLGGTRLGEIALWGRNLLDEDAVNNFIDFGPTFQNLTVANFVEPRTIGLAGILRW